MSDALQAVAAEMAEAGRRASSRFDADRFHDLAGDVGATLWELIGDEPHAQVVLRSYLRLVAEAVGMGCLVPDADGNPRDLLSHLFGNLVPFNLERVPPGERAACLAALWNLGEGLLQEPAWLNHYAIAFCDYTDLRALPGRLATSLEPVLVPPPPSGWAGPCTVAVVQPATIIDVFLPGAMHLATPSVVCVHDRRVDGFQVGLLLAHGGQSRLLGAVPCLGSTLHEGALPAVTFGRDHVAIGEHQVRVPHLREPLEKLVTAAGFVVASAADSQRLWIVDTP
jgi:hypothetical protein